MFDTYKSCHGCPYRTISCHGECDGYADRVRKNEIKYAERMQKIRTTYTPVEVTKRTKRMRKD